MKRCLFFFTVLFLLTNLSCKKLIEKKQEQIVMDAITNGIWLVEKYVEATTDISQDFAGYEFKFNKDGTVTGTKAGISTNGTWVGNVSNYSITSNFPSAGNPVIKLNGIWILTDSYLDYVEAKMTTSTGNNILHLRKKQ